jgi:predicted nucleic acid-binding protein
LLADLVASGNALTTSAVNVTEVYAGMRSGEDVIKNLFASIECIPVTASIAERAGNLKNWWARRGTTLGTVDVIVAATALEYCLHLATDNWKDFPMPDLSFYPLP